MTVRELLQKLNTLASNNNINPEAIVVGAGDESASEINDITYEPKCTSETLPYDGAGLTDHLLGKDILILQGDWS